ncbi:methyltransferase regulatory domain-containing protein [Aquabacterium humicola]|uniref:methyltransferase regulatory domain-containing protein n=1 Tax=Aquabacterium humicola TaxID=3237377 RepID=UPI0025438B9E|nr:methyltransferase regulatory domain-containing protein [Rubrivivax pictus]
MTDWTAGYVADIGYTYGYYAEMNPLRMKLAFLRAGLMPPEVGTACELGFGQGLGTNLHAAASATHWCGTDFNPAQAAFAQQLAAASGSGARLLDESFAEFTARTDLPDFDFIALHGIWSWINDDNRHRIVDFVRRKLKVGGVLYTSYNTLPGWAPFAPMRHLLARHAEVMGTDGRGIVSQVDDALAFADQLLAQNPNYVRANPMVPERLKQVKAQDRHYVAHEYFNRDWHPMHFATMAEWLAPAKLGFACPAHLLDHVDNLNLTPEQQDFLKAIPDAGFRESVRDFITNQQFRRDYWVKGARRLNALERTEALRAQRLALVSHRPDVLLKVTGVLGEAQMNEEATAPILDLLADHAPRSIAEIEAAAKLPFGKLVQCLTLLCGSSHVFPVQDEAAAAAARGRCERLNRQLMLRSRADGEVGHLASPLIGGGVPVGRFPQLFLLARSQGGERPQDWARYAWNLLAQQNQRLLKDGHGLQTPEENLAEMGQLAQRFEQKELPALRALQVA